MTASVLTVSELNRRVKDWLEHDIGSIAVTGEISNLSRPASGHIYFTLKDAGAQLRCVYFKNYHQQAHQFKDGQQIMAEGRLSLYEARGEYQLKVQAMTLYGLGELYRQYELLKQKLESQGLFAQPLKKPLPVMPERIAIITSPSGAALHDMLTTLNRRYPLAKIDIYGCEVQGKTAPMQLIAALKRANADKLAEVIVLARGGGSIEDLWAFNDERLAYAIRESLIPVVSGIGHETDFTIADFVADKRAATPTAAAEAVTPNQAELLALLRRQQQRLQISIRRILQQAALKLSHLQARVATPDAVVEKHWQTLDYLQRTLTRTTNSLLNCRENQLQVITARLQAQNPQRQLAQTRRQLNQISHRLLRAMEQHHAAKQQLYKQLLNSLQTVSPLATLDRGYAIATHENKVLRNAKQVTAGDKINVRLAKGQLHCEVLAKP